MSDNGIIVMRGTGPQWNPVWFTPKRCREIEARNPTAYLTDVLNEFQSPESNLFASTALEIATRKEPLELPCSPGMHYAAAMDPGTRSNSWTLAIIEADLSNPRRPKYRVALAREWTGSKLQPLRTDIVLGEIAKCCHRYTVREVITDQWSIDALKPQAADVGLRLRERNMGTAERVDAYDTAKDLLNNGSLELAPVPQLREDLLRVKKRVTQSGMTIELPLVGGRHCDFAPSLVLALQYVGLVARRAASSGESACNWGGCPGPQQLTDGRRIPYAYDEHQPKPAAVLAAEYRQARAERVQELLTDE